MNRSRSESVGGPVTVVRVRVSGAGALPVRGSADAAGADLRAAEALTLAPGERAAVGTGLRLEIPRGYAGLVWPRSGLAVRDGIDTLAGVIDADYRGEVKVVLVNHGQRAFQVSPGDRIAQLLVQRVEQTTFVAVDALDATERGESGFGSTGS
jgi:dUTP pyrophosphatase